MNNFQIRSFPRTRIATFDVGAVSRSKHHVAMLLECDVTVARARIKDNRQKGHKTSFTAYLIKAIADTVAKHPDVAGYIYGRHKRITFDEIKVSMLVEKEVGGNRVPIPMVIEKANEKSAETITSEIEAAKAGIMTANDIVLHQKTTATENLYYLLPGFLRRAIWWFMLNQPKLAYKKMGNVVVTSVGMMGRISGWFVHTSVHPLSIGIGSVVKKPWVVGDEIEIREILNLTVLMDHDVIDGAPMTRFITALVKVLEG